MSDSEASGSGEVSAASALAGIGGGMLGTLRATVGSSCIAAEAASGGAGLAIVFAVPSAAAAETATAALTSCPRA